MSIPERQPSRGFSPGAGFVLAALLTLVAVAVQSTVPTFVQPSSQGAEVGTAADRGYTNTSASQPSQPPTTNAPIEDGKDQASVIIVGQAPLTLYLPVCPKGGKQTQEQKDFATWINSNSKFPGSRFGVLDNSRCQPDPASAQNPKPLIPISGKDKWAWTLTCSSDQTASSGTAQPGIKRDITTQDMNTVKFYVGNSAYKCRMDPPGTQSGTKSPQEIQSIAKALANTTDSVARTQVVQGLSAPDQNALTKALTQQATDLTKQNTDLDARNKEIDSQLQKLAANCSEISENIEACNQSKSQIDGLNAEKTKNQSQMIDNLKQLNNLDAAKVALNPVANPDPTKIPPTSPPPVGPPPPYSGGGGGGYGGFGNPAVGANNTPQSPFGGACNTRYICSGNTLYYQSTGPQYTSYNPIVIQGQCTTQPVQQCPYGCQQLNQTGTQSTLGNIASGLQIASLVTRLFGGGGSSNNTNTMVNNNLPSQCAMTPQNQQQSPYGNGTNGQPCYQPPPQPDPAQCTSGTWRPTSAQQNGCATGWQCVPGGDGTGTNPSAQLSCQPKIADVGMPISFSFACANASGSTGTGFSTGGALSGNATTTAPNPPAGQNFATYTLTCINQGVTSSAQCQVELSKSGIVLITNPKTVNGGETSLIGWITAGMQSCVISSPDQQDFTARNTNNTSVSGAATTSPITGETHFRLDCQTAAGGTKSASATVSLN